jgi:hypothetical protein
MLMIILGGTGIFVGILGMVMFFGYHHDHDIEEEITESKKDDFLAWTRRHTKSKRKSPGTSRQTTVAEAPLITEQIQNEAIDKLDKNIKTAPEPISHLDAFTYENVEIEESRIYATLHALCLHSFVNFLNNEINIFIPFFLSFRSYY